VFVRELAIVDKCFFDGMKAAIEDKAKAYQAVVWCKNEITQADC
jgi:hypothetical protein